MTIGEDTILRLVECLRTLTISTIQELKLLLASDRPPCLELVVTGLGAEDSAKLASNLVPAIYECGGPHEATSHVRGQLLYIVTVSPTCRPL